MKKRILLFTAIAGIGYLTLTSGSNGAGAEKGFNCTGSETGLGNYVGCMGSGCHNATASTGLPVALELDSAGTSITHYTPGVTYTVKIKGTNNTAATLPKFGFQVSCIKGATAQTTPVNAGTFVTTGLPANVRYTAPILTPAPGYFVCSLIEHSNPILATTLGGATGGTYVDSFQWKAPLTGTGAVSFWGALNAVDGDGFASPADIWNTTHLVLSETDTVATVSHEAVANVTNTIEVNALPNPVGNNLILQMDNGEKGNYSIQVFDLSGKSVSNENIAINSNQAININTSNWAPGLYQVVIQKDGIRHIVRVVKNL